MESRKAGYAIVLVILLCALALGSTEANRRTAEFFSGNADDKKSSPEMVEDTAELAWIHCRNELIGRKDVEDFDFYIPLEATHDLKSTLLAKRNMQKAFSILPPQMKQTLLDCLRKKSRSFRVSSQEASFKHWFINRVKLLFGWPNAPRRYLVSESQRQIAPSPAPAPATAPLSYGLTPFNPALTPTSPNMLLTIEALEEILASFPPPTPPKHSPPSPPPSAHKHSPPSPHVTHHLSKKHDDSQLETIVGAVAATAVATFVVVALLFCCCLSGSSNKIGPRDGIKDERPLLNLSLSDFSAGSSQKSISLGNSSNKEFSINSGKNLSMKSDNYDLSFAEAPSSAATTTGSIPPLKPPPGRSIPPPPGQPPPPPGPRPPPPPKVARPPPAPPKLMPGKTPPLPPGPHGRGNSNSSEGDDDSVSGAPKAKLKPFFWDKVLASPDHSMVWNEIRAGSFQFNEEMIESLFGYNAVDKNKNDRKKESSSLEPSIQYIQIIDTRKAQNLSILLRALNVTTDEVIDALREGNELPVELLQTLLKMAPTTEEELKLRLFTGDLSQLGPAERFLKVLVDIPFAFKRLESLLFMTSLQEEVSGIKESFATLEVASNKLRNSRLFLKLLEAVLKTGNRMNDGTYRGGAQAFKLDTLLKLADVKGIDGKTTLLHFVVQEIIRSEGIRAVRTATASRSLSSVKSEDFVEDSNHESAEHYRALGLQVVSGLSSELEDVKKAAIIDADVLVGTVSKLRHSLVKTRDFLTSEIKSVDEDSEFYHALVSFVERAENDISWLSEEEKRIMALVKSTVDYFHGNAGKDEGLHLFAIVRDFLIMIDKTCKEVRDATATKSIRNFRKEAPTLSTSENRQPSSDIRQRVFPAIVDRRMDSSSSDDESPSS